MICKDPSWWNHWLVGLLWATILTIALYFLFASTVKTEDGIVPFAGLKTSLKIDTTGYFLAICGDTSRHSSQEAIRDTVLILFQDGNPDCDIWCPKVWPDIIMWYERMTPDIEDQRSILRVDTIIITVFPHIHATTPSSSIPQSARYYAKVDTVGYWCTPSTDCALSMPGPWNKCLLESEWFTPMLDTIWLPKVQDWLTPDELKAAVCVRIYGGHDFSGAYTISRGPQRYTCRRCGWSVVK